MSIQILTNAAQSKLVRDKLSKWEASTTLNQLQKDCILDLATWSSVDDKIYLPSTDVMNLTECHDQSAVINNAQQFYEWFHSVERGMESDQESEYRDYMNNLKEHRERCDAVLHGISKALDHLRLLSKQYRTVSHTTEALHDSCELLMQDQEDLEELGNSISQQLVYFTEHERIGTKLNSSSISVMGESFVPMLVKIDECVQFMKDHPDYKESSMYLAKYQQCLIRALTLLRSYIVSSIKSTSVNASNSFTHARITVPGDPDFAQLYSKFHSSGPRIKALMEQIEQRSDRNPEYLQVMQDCYTCYCYQRQSLILPLIGNEIERLYKLHSKDHCTFIRTSCMALIRICQDEHALYHCFFSRSDLILQGLLETLSSQLYDYFRPMIIQQVYRFELLADICNVLKNDVIEDQVNSKGESLEAFGHLALQMLEDSQERLSYRTQAYIQSDITNFLPSPGDLAYPSKLNEDLSNQYGMWYPTVRRSLICLSKLYRCTNRSVFESLAQECLSACIDSLRRASQSICESSSLLDSQLFLIKHLLILREQIAPFDVNFTVNEVSIDFSNLKLAATDLITNKNRILSLSSNNALLEFLFQGAPQLTKKVLDSKKEVDINLKEVCQVNKFNDFIIVSLSLLSSLIHSHYFDKFLYISSHQRLLSALICSSHYFKKQKRMSISSNSLIIGFALLAKKYFTILFGNFRFVSFELIKC